ncbi:IS1 family transposase [Escherichia coli]|nr:IS1 family transposase [Escherichia coli]
MRQKFTNFHFNQFQQLFVINHVAFVQDSKSVELHDKVIGHYLNIKHYQ